MSTSPSDRMPASDRTRVRRVPGNAAYDADTIDAILRAGMLAHVGIQDEGQPFVIPMVYGWDKKRVLLHGSTASRLMRAIADGAEVCVTVTLVDGLVLARSLFHHSMNYRSVCVFGRGAEITGAEPRLAALRTITEQLVPERWEEARGPNASELKRTLVVEVPVEEASAKVRVGPPNDEEEDYALPVWAGVLPLELRAGEAQPDARLAGGIATPAWLAGYGR